MRRRVAIPAALAREIHLVANRPVFANAAHFLALDAPDEVLAQVVPWLDKLGAPGGGRQVPTVTRSA